MKAGIPSRMLRAQSMWVFVTAGVFLAFFVVPFFALAAPTNSDVILEELPGAIDSVLFRGVEIQQGDVVYKDQLSAPDTSPNDLDHYWTFRFTWPNPVQVNLDAMYMVFRGTFGNIEGGAPVQYQNFDLNFQPWPGGYFEQGKYISVPALNAESTLPGMYTVMIVERDPNYRGFPELQAEWFASGGTSGVSPKKYSLMTFELKEQSTPDPVIIIPGILGSAEKNGVWVIDPLLHTYDNLIDALDLNGYTLGTDLFTLPYDWRNSNIITATALKLKIDEIQNVCNCEKVDLVAHSMGGLVARQYIQSDQYGGDVDQLIFLGTPHLGSPKAYLMWEAGELDPKDGLLFKTFLKFQSFEFGYPTLLEYIRDWPISSVRQLLGIDSYLVDASDGTARAYPFNYPRNQFLEDLSNGVGALQANGVRIKNIIGDNQREDTVASIRVQDSPSLFLWEHGIPEGWETNKALGLEVGVGDGTVPIASAKASFTSTTISSPHNRLPTDAQGLVIAELTGTTQSLFVDVPFPTRVLIAQIFSPADIVVIAPDGKKFGKNFETGEEVNEIPGAFYSGFETDNEYITIPDPIDGEYKILTQGTGLGGQYTLVTGYADNATSTEDYFIGTTPPGTIIEHDFVLDSEVPENNELTYIDTLPPVVTFIQPSLTSYARSGSLPVNVSVSDVSGIASSSISFDGKPISFVTTINLLPLQLGTHLFRAYAEDSFGNATTSLRRVNVVATFASTKADVQRIYGLGWIKEKSTRDDILNKLSDAESKKAQIDALLADGTRTRLDARVAALTEKYNSILNELLQYLKNANKVEGGKQKLTNEGYNLLVEDVRWLINNL